MADGKRLWDKGEGINDLVHQFTVGDDPVIDLELVRWDAIASAAHAKMLAGINVLTEAELKKLLKALSEIVAMSDAEDFQISSELEDCHTAIEAILVEKTGEAGKKIHTGRSRNDQVITATRLYLRHEMLNLVTELLEVAEVLSNRVVELGDTMMPGYTHLQRAMPSSVLLWLGSFVEHAAELVAEGLHILEATNKNPLGAASGFGVPLPLDRELTTNLLGFSSVQRNPAAVQNSRGRYELKFMRWAEDVGALIEKLSSDLILFNTSEFGFLKLPDELTSGSSIMPQKRNPDVLELLRGRVGGIRGAKAELEAIISKLPSNYHRDFQLVKSPVVRTVDSLSEMLPVFREVISSFGLNKDALDAALTTDLYVTYDAYRQVKEGVPFREAYQKTAKKYEAGEIIKEDLEADFLIIQQEAKDDLSAVQSDLEDLQRRALSWVKTLEEVEEQAFKI